MTNKRPFILTTNPHTAQEQFFDGETYDVLATVKTLPQPHEMCLTADKTRAYISHRLSGMQMGLNLASATSATSSKLQQERFNNSRCGSHRACIHTFPDVGRRAASASCAQGI